MLGAWQHIVEFALERLGTELPSEPADEPGGQRAGLEGTSGHDELARRRAKRTG